MSPLAIQLLGTVLASSVVGVIINAIVQRKNLGASTGKLSAEATKVISDAAAGVVTNIERDNDRLRGEMEELIAEHRGERGRLMAQIDRDSVNHARDRAEWALERESWRQVLQVHAAWDAMAIHAVNSAVPPIELPDAPPLTPPMLHHPQVN